jgi:hypothetical protein
LEAPTTKKPPITNLRNINIEKDSRAIRYDATEENRTLKESLYLVKTSILENKDMSFILKDSDINYRLKY